LQLVTELIPNPARIAILVRETSPTAAQYVRESRAAAQSMGIALTIKNARDATDLDTMFLAVNGVSVLLVADDAEFTAQRFELARLRLKHRLPTVSGLKEMVQAGGLMAYGGSFAELYRRAASHVHKILQGTSPAELPVEQAIKFDLAINLNTAKALGLDIPPTLLARADANFSDWQGALPRSRPCRSAHGRRSIRRARCGSSSPFPPAKRPTPSRV
jgi:putative ABC transport system substrate-binding protein